MSTTIVETRDGRLYVGCIRSYDHYGNVVLDRCVERVRFGGDFGELYLGLMFIRGETIAYFGHLQKPSPVTFQTNLQRIQDTDSDSLAGATITDGRKVPLDAVFQLQRKHQLSKVEAAKTWEYYRRINEENDEEHVKDIIMQYLSAQRPGTAIKEEDFVAYIASVRKAQQILSDRTMDEL